jgi:hypothetical protein
MLQKAPDARPASAREVAEKLSPFVSAARVPRGATSAGSRRTAESRANEATVDTLVSKPAPPSPRERERALAYADTVNLVERATQPRQISTALALVLIVLLSLVAGLTAYVLRVRIGSAPDASAFPQARGDAESRIDHAVVGPRR